MNPYRFISNVLTTSPLWGAFVGLFVLIGVGKGWDVALYVFGGIVAILAVLAAGVILDAWCDDKAYQWDERKRREGNGKVPGR